MIGEKELIEKLDRYLNVVTNAEIYIDAGYVQDLLNLGLNKDYFYISSSRDDFGDGFIRYKDYNFFVFSLSLKSSNQIGFTDFIGLK